MTGGRLGGYAHSPGEGSGGGGGPSVGQCRRVFQVGGPSQESFSFEERSVG